MVDHLVDHDLGPTDTCTKRTVLFDERIDAARTPSHYFGHYDIFAQKLGDTPVIERVERIGQLAHFPFADSAWAFKKE